MLTLPCVSNHASERVTQQERDQHAPERRKIGRGSLQRQHMGKTTHTTRMRMRTRRQQQHSMRACALCVAHRGSGDLHNNDKRQRGEHVEMQTERTRRHDASRKQQQKRKRPLTARGLRRVRTNVVSTANQIQMNAPRLGTQEGKQEEWDNPREAGYKRAYVTTPDVSCEISR